MLNPKQFGEFLPNYDLEFESDTNGGQSQELREPWSTRKRRVTVKKVGQSELHEGAREQYRGTERKMNPKQNPHTYRMWGLN